MLPEVKLLTVAAPLADTVAAWIAVAVNDGVLKDPTVREPMPPFSRQ